MYGTEWSLLGLIRWTLMFHLFLSDGYLFSPGEMNAVPGYKCLHNGIAAGIRVMFFNFRCILIQQSIQDIGCFAHRAVDHIDPVLFAPVVDVVVERDPTTHPKKAPIMPGVHVGGCHPKANAIRRRGFPIVEKRCEGKRSMIGNEMMDRRSQGFFAEIPIICCFQFM